MCKVHKFTGSKNYDIIAFLVNCTFCSSEKKQKASIYVYFTVFSFWVPITYNKHYVQFNPVLRNLYVFIGILLLFRAVFGAPVPDPLRRCGWSGSVPGIGSEALPSCSRVRSAAAAAVNLSPLPDLLRTVSGIPSSDQLRSACGLRGCTLWPVWISSGKMWRVLLRLSCAHLCASCGLLRICMQSAAHRQRSASDTVSAAVFRSGYGIKRCFLRRIRYPRRNQSAWHRFRSAAGSAPGSFLVSPDNIYYQG